MACRVVRWFTIDKGQKLGDTNHRLASSQLLLRFDSVEEDGAGFDDLLDRLSTNGRVEDVNPLDVAAGHGLVIVGCYRVPQKHCQNV